MTPAHLLPRPHSTDAQLAPQAVSACDAHGDLIGSRERLQQAGGAVTELVTRYTYHRPNRLTCAVQAGVSGGHAVAEKRVDFSYAADSQPAAVTRYEDLACTKLVAASTFSYDPVARLQGLTHLPPAK